MKRKLVICEKPSVAQSVARVLGANQRKNGWLESEDWIVTWCAGHLVDLAEPEVYDPRYKKWEKADLPILPQQWQYQVPEYNQKQFAVVRDLMDRSDVERLVCATDAGREGELIFRLVYHQCGCTKPFDRLWISSMEDAAIRDGFEHLRPGSEYDSLYEAALCREHADWLVGINGTRFFSSLYGRTYHVGRVISPTLAMVVLREAEIRSFVPEPFYTIQLELPEVTAASEKLKEKSRAETLAKDCAGQSAIVTSCECKVKSEKAPALFDLTTLQREANRRLGYTAQQTMDYAQSLYERKIITYPRTDSRFLTDDMAELVPDLVRIASQLIGIQVPESCQYDAVVDSSKVSDHFALIPTRTAAQADIDDLPLGERELLRMIAVRLVAAVSPPFRFAETMAVFQCGDTDFTAKGRTILDQGWRAVERPMNEDRETRPLPEFKEGDCFTVSSASVKEGQTKAKPHYTEDTLLAAMERAGADEMPDEVERKGIGTPATRAGVIERLVIRGFLERSGSKKSKNLIPTEKGFALITVLPEQLQSASMTADWEEKLLKIEKGEYAPEQFMAEIEDMLKDLMQNYQVVKEAQVFMPDTDKSLGKCPACGSDVVERRKAWSCTNRQCRFALWKENRYFDALGKRMTESVVKSLLQNGSVRLRDCYSKRLDRHYDTTIALALGTDGTVSFEMRKE